MNAQRRVHRGTLRERRLPPGQRRVEGFPRFGEHLARPAPAVPPAPVIEIRGAVTEELDVPLAALSALPRRELIADFHCVAGWSAVGLNWEGTAFGDFYGAIIAPALHANTTVTRLSFHGLDGFRSSIWLEDALAAGVLIATRLGGRPLDSDHGAPARLVSPAQYGYVGTKHLSRIEVHTADTEPADASPLLLRNHPRARVALEERHGFLPAWVARPLYRALKTPLLAICARGAGRVDE